MTWTCVEDVLFVGGGNVVLCVCPAPGGERSSLDDPPQLLDLLPIDRIGTDADLETVEVGRIMASGNHHAAVHPIVAYGEIEHRGGAQADIGHVDPRGHDPPSDGLLIGFRTETAIPAKGHFSNAMAHGIGADRPAEKMGEVGVEIPVYDSTDIILPEYIAIHCVPDDGKMRLEIDMRPDHLCDHGDLLGVVFGRKRFQALDLSGDLVGIRGNEEEGDLQFGGFLDDVRRRKDAVGEDEVPRPCSPAQRRSCHADLRR